MGLSLGMEVLAGSVFAFSILQALAGAIFAPSLYLASVLHPCALPQPQESQWAHASPLLSCSPAKASGCTPSTQSLECLALEARGGLVFLGPHGTETVGETVPGRLPSPGYGIDS